MTNKGARYLELLQRAVLQFIENLEECVFTDDSDQAVFAVINLFFKVMPQETLMNHFVRHVLPFKTKIKDQDKDFFIENDTIFAGLPQTELSRFREKILALDEEDIKVIWSHFSIMLLLVERYKKEQ